VVVKCAAANQSAAKQKKTFHRFLPLLDAFDDYVLHQQHSEVTSTSRKSWLQQSSATRDKMCR
jgi:hypothetical protein